jgi:hypothetical protein
MSTARSELSGTGSFHWHSEPCASATRHVSLCLRPVERELAPVRHPGHCRATNAHAHAWEAGDSSIVRRSGKHARHPAMRWHPRIGYKSPIAFGRATKSVHPFGSVQGGVQTRYSGLASHSAGCFCQFATPGPQGVSFEIPRNAMVRRVKVQSNERQQYSYRPLLLFITGSRQPNVRRNSAAVRRTQGDKRQWWHIGQCNAVMASGPLRFQGLFFFHCNHGSCPGRLGQTAGENMLPGGLWHI